MTQQSEGLSESDQNRVGEMREWVVGHYENPGAYESISGKLTLLQTILDNKWIQPDETWKLQSLGIAFGDALEQQVPELSWVVVEDEYGRDPALRWLETTTLVFPLTSISKRIEDGVNVNIDEIFQGFQNALQQAISQADQ